MGRVVSVVVVVACSESWVSQQGDGDDDSEYGTSTSPWTLRRVNTLGGDGDGRRFVRYTSGWLTGWLLTVVPTVTCDGSL